MFSRVPRYTYYCSNLFISLKARFETLNQSQLLTISGVCINRHTKLKIKSIPRIKSFPKAISGRQPSHHLPNPVNTFPKQIHITCLYQSSFHFWLWPTSSYEYHHHFTTILRPYLVVDITSWVSIVGVIISMNLSINLW